VVSYQYDNYGDLVRVTLPDNTLGPMATSITPSPRTAIPIPTPTTLLTSETKPDGRQLANIYDNLRRVITQQATVGINRELITNAWFFYTNNCTGLTNGYISGVTCVRTYSAIPTIITIRTIS
jgi:hypothetical protein